MVESYSIVTPEEVSWFQQDLEQRIHSEGERRITDGRWWDTRVSLVNQRHDPARNRAIKILQRARPDIDTDSLQSSWIAYHRQLKPQGLHIDQMSHVPPKHGVSAIIPLTEYKNHFNTVVFDVHCEDFEEFDKTFCYKYLSQLPVIADRRLDGLKLDHLHPNMNVADRYPLDGIFQWRLGTIGVFTRTNLHCSTNWKNQQFRHKDFVVFHCP